MSVPARDLSLVIIIVGPRGGNKTLLMTGLEIEAMARAWAVKRARELSGEENLYPRKKVNIWSSYPVLALWRPPGQKKPINLSATPLEMEKVLTWNEEIRDGWLFWDEIDQDADRQDWMAQAPKLIVKGIKLMRHRRITLVAALQFLDELNIRLYKQADIIIQCRDKAFTSWGREKGLEPGEVANTTWIDKSGMMTGYTFDETKQFYNLQFFGQRYWDSYLTEHEFDILKPKYKVEQEVRKIMTREHAEQMQVDNLAIYNALQYYTYEMPGKRVPSVDLIEKAREFGCTLHSSNIGKKLTELGIKRAERRGLIKYDLGSLNTEALEKMAI